MEAMGFRIGLGSDLHALDAGNGIPLGGVLIPCEYSCRAISDGDVLLHALVDALLGACGAGDIGEHFNERNVSPGEDSSRFIDKTLGILAERRARIVNIDCIINIERPRLSAWKGKIRDNMAALLSLPATRVNVKAKTGEGVGPIGESRAISAEVSVLLEIDE